MLAPPSQGFATQQIHAGVPPDQAYNSITTPIFASAAFSFNSSEYIEELVARKRKGFIYSRIHNPTVEVFENRMATLEGGFPGGAVAASSGQSATMLAVLALAKAGDNFIVPHKLYGGTWQQFASFLPRFGITGKFVDSLEPADFESQIDANTKGILLESLANPILELPDIEAFAEVAHKHGIPLIIDNTFAAGGYLLRPIDLGADIVIHSATKWISGHGSVLGGVVVTSGRFDFAASGKFPEFTEPLSGYHGLVLSRDAGPMALAVKMRMETLREMGCAMSPYVAHQLLQGLETLSVRVDKHCANAQALASYLNDHEAVSWVSHPSLPTHPSHELAKTLLKRGLGGMVSFGLKGDVDGSLSARVLNHFKLAVHCGNVGDVRTLVVSPARTVQRQLSKENLAKNGTPDDLIRVSVGLEDINDIVADFKQAIEAGTAIASTTAEVNEGGTQ